MNFYFKLLKLRHNSEQYTYSKVWKRKHSLWMILSWISEGMIISSHVQIKFFQWKLTGKNSIGNKMRKASDMTGNKVSFENLFLLEITEKLFSFLSWIYSCLSFPTTQTWKQVYRKQSCVENCNRSDFVCFPIYRSDILHIRNVILCRISMFSSYFISFT